MTPLLESPAPAGDPVDFTDIPPADPAAAWAEYCDDLRTALSDLDDAVLGHRVPEFPELRPPQVMVPPELTDRCSCLLAMLEDVTARTQARRDELAAALRALPSRRTARAAPSHAYLGGRVDVVG